MEPYRESSTEQAGGCMVEFLGFLSAIGAVGVILGAVIVAAVERRVDVLVFVPIGGLILGILALGCRGE